MQQRVVKAAAGPTAFTRDASRKADIRTQLSWVKSSSYPYLKLVDAEGAAAARELANPPLIHLAGRHYCTRGWHAMLL